MVLEEERRRKEHAEGGGWVGVELRLRGDGEVHHRLQLQIFNQRKAQWLSLQSAEGNSKVEKHHLPRAVQLEAGPSDSH